MIYDCFPFYNELNILELRLHQHAPFVDKFVLVEGTKTFQGKPKRMFFEENKSRFEKFLDRIIHVQFDFPDVFDKSYLRVNEIWARDYYQRDQIIRGLNQAKPDDLIIVSDVDEMLREDVFLRSLKERHKYDLTMYETENLRFFINRKFDVRLPREQTVKWIGPKMVEFARFGGAQNMRETKWFKSARLHGTLLGQLHTQLYNWQYWNHPTRPFLVRNAGWHFSSIGDWENMRLKFESYAHNECMTLDVYHSHRSFEEMLRTEGSYYPANDLPAYALAHPEMFPLYKE